MSKFDPDATVEEIAGLGRHPGFDALVNDKDDDSLQVICKRGADEIPLANPARAFYFGDRVLYAQEAQRFDSDHKQRVLNCAIFPRNERRFDELKRACQRGFVIPFVGAGMSASAGCKGWRDYLLSLCPEAGFDEATMRERLHAGDYEGVLEDLVTKLTEERFNLDFERDFKPSEDFEGAVMRLPELFDSAAITTNFDRVLEIAYERNGRSFVEKTTARGAVNAFYRALPAGERYLLKLHGNLDNVADRVLRRGEYDSAYGEDGNIHFECPVPKLLRRLYTSFSFLFLGCSLTFDRTVQTFTKIAQDVGPDSLPHHYAILAYPDDLDERNALEARLAAAHISSIWIPDGHFHLIEEILCALRS